MGVPSAFAPAFGVALTALLASAACAGPSEERHLDSMRAEIDAIQKDRDRADDVPLDPVVAEPGVPRPAAPASPLPGPVTLGTGEAPGPEDAPDVDDPAPRPALRVLGAARASGGRWRGGDQVEETFPPDGSGPSSGAAPSTGTPAAPAIPAALDPQAKRSYDAALSLVSARKYAQALDALAAFLLKWPDHPYADNAMYWRGECYFAGGDYSRAAEQFEGVLARFPAGNKVSDSLLKLGMCRQKLGDPNGAKEMFARLTQLYPRSEAARRIPTVTVPAATPSGPPAEDRR